MNYSSGYEHHQQEQQQNAYDPSQIQAYDQSSLSYYGYNQQYAYYPSQYTNSYTQQTHQQIQQEPASIHPPGVPIPPEPVHSQTHLQNQQNVHFLSGVVENQQQLNSVSGSAAAGSVNPAAVAALSQLSHLGGNMDVAQGAMNLPIGQSQYRGGRRFRGGGRGQFHHRGRGRGRSGGRHFPPHTSGPAISNVVSKQAAAGISSVAQSSSSVPGQLLLPMPAQVPTAPLRLPPHKAWCEICKVDCNTAEILEQHKNGKRHKKNLLVHEELQRLKAINRQQSGEMPTSQLNLAVQPEKVQESEKNGCPPENMSSGAPNNYHKNEIELQKDTGETSEVPTEKPEEKPRDNFAVGGRGFKRKMRGGRGGKYMRANDGPRRPVEPPISKQPIPFICELCNVKCESQVVFDSHLTGKKHLSSLKRVHGPQALYGGGGLQALYPPPLDINALSNSINQQVRHGASDPQVLLAQLLMNYVLSQTQVPATAPPPGHVPAQVPASTPAVSQHVSETQVSEGTSQGESDNPTGETKIELLSVPAQLDGPEGSIKKTQTADGSPESQVKVVNLTQDNLVMALPENPDAANDQIPSQ